MEFSTLNGYKVKDKKAIRFYDTIDDMKNDNTLKEGMHVKTKGYYSINDGGASEYHITGTESNSDYQEELDNGLYATLISENNEVNVKQFGAKGDSVTDDTISIQNALNSDYNIYFPKGDYLINSTLTIPFNKKIIGENRKNTNIIANFNNDFIINYGNEYNYNGYSGLIKDLCFRTTEDTNKPKGIYLYSACTIENIDFYQIGQCISRVSSYIDLITLKNVYCGYCVPNGNYIINLYGNQDALYINQLKIAKYQDDETQYNGIYIRNCHGGSINNSIININITLEMCNAFSINNTHMEATEKSINIIDSDVSLNNMFKFKSVTSNDINISSSGYEFTTIVELNNFSFYKIGSGYDFNTLSEEINELSTNTILKINRCYRQFNFGDVGRTTFTAQGIMIKNNNLFNFNSKKLSLNSTIINGNVSDKIEYNEGIVSTAGLGSTATSSIAHWKGVATDSMHYRAGIILDETRKLLAGFSNDGAISDITNNSIPIIALNIQWGQNIYLFRGSATQQYTERCLLPNLSRTLLLDNYYSVNGYPWESIPSTNLQNDYLRIGYYQKIGDNVIIKHNTTPTLGTWTEGDKIINTNITTGQPISWIYDGTNWISQGSY